MNAPDWGIACGEQTYEEDEKIMEISRAQCGPVNETRWFVKNENNVQQ